MDKQRHVAVWLRMLAEKEIKLARGAKSLLKSTAKRAAEGYKARGQSEAEYVIKQDATKWLHLLTAHTTETAKTLISYTFDQLGASKRSFQDIVQSYLLRNALQKSNLIGGTTLTQLREVIAQAVDDGLGEAETAARIEKALGGDIDDSRARTIARTEIHNAATFGMQAAAEETQQELIREWVAVEDERTREAHADADGQQKGMDEPFEVDGELIDRPGEGSPENSINCRCTIIYTPVNHDITGDSHEGDTAEED